MDRLTSCNDKTSCAANTATYERNGKTCHAAYVVTYECNSKTYHDAKSRRHTSAKG